MIDRVSRGSPGSHDGAQDQAIGDRATIVVYSKPDCHLCADAVHVLRGLQSELGFEIRECDITEEEALHREYFERIPVVMLDGVQVCEYFVDEPLLRERLESRR
jgi:glutaredoxin